jgi:effector-binding domain-containing protein
MGHGRVCGEPVPEGQQACVLHEESAEGVFSALDRLFGDWS